eukprot:Skav203470  [mRNA]  locus=scaffold921:27318:43516:+ [translate_table: standard]
MSVASSLFSSISGYIPTAVKDAAGLSPQISEAVRHITWLSIERSFWPEDRKCQIRSYTDGFQLWDFTDPAAGQELVSKQDKAVSQAGGQAFHRVPYSSLLDAMGVTAAPLMAYLHKGAPALVRLFSLSFGAGSQFVAVSSAKGTTHVTQLQAQPLGSDPLDPRHSGVSPAEDGAGCGWV